MRPFSDVLLQVGGPESLDRASLAAAVTETANPGDRLDRVSVAGGMADALRELGDSLVEQFVAEARDAGHSWSEIGRALGVSKQAAQQKHVAPEWALFTTRARRVVELADAEAEKLGHNFIGLEHLVVALAEEGTGVAFRALASLDLTARALRAKVKSLVGAGKERKGPRPFTPRAKKVLTDVAPREASQLGHHYVGTEHLLLAICTHRSNMGAAILQDLGVQLASVKQAVLEVLSGHVAESGPTDA